MLCVCIGCVNVHLLGHSILYIHTNTYTYTHTPTDPFKSINDHDDVVEWEGIADDWPRNQVSLPFPVVFYGEQYEEFLIDPNGFILFQVCVCVCVCECVCVSV
jgi:hypothetical protein